MKPYGVSFLNKSSYIVFIVLLLVLTISGGVIVYTAYTEWLVVTDYITYNGVDYPVIDAKGIATTEYGSIGPYVYSMYYIHNSTSNRNYTMLIEMDSDSNLLNKLLLYSSNHVNVKPGEVEVSPKGDYLAAVLFGENIDGDMDGFIFLSDVNITGAASLVFDKYENDTVDVYIWDVYYAVNNEIFVGGAVYNKTSNEIQALIIVYSFNGTHLFFERAATYKYNDPDGLSNDHMITDLVIGPDGYLYATIYVPYYYNGEWLDYKGIIAKIDPVSLGALNYTTIKLYNTAGYYQLATFTGSLAADENSIYATFNSISEYYGAPGYTSSGLIIKLTPNFVVEWFKVFDNIDYDEMLYDIVVTTDNVTLVGMTNSNYGSTSFSDYNGIILSLDPLTGNPKYGLLIGGTGYDQLKDPSISWDQRLYVIGVSDTTSFYEKYIPASTLEVAVKNIDKLHTGSRSVKYIVENNHLRNPLYIELINRFTELKKNGSSKPVIVVGRTGLYRISYKTTGGNVKMGVTEGLTIKKIDEIHSRDITVKQAYTPGILLKLSVSTGQQVLPPEPVPENYLLVLFAISLTGIIGYYYVYKKSRK